MNKLLSFFTRSTRPELSRGLKQQLAWLTVPIFIETLLIMTIGAVDTFMLSQHSDLSVAAVGVVNQIVMLCFLIFEVINIGTSVLVSQYIGAGKPDRMVKIVGVSLVVNLLVGAIVSAMLYFCASGLLHMMGLTGSLLAEGMTYMRIVGAFAFFQALSMTISATLRACNKAVYPMLVVAVVNVVNIIGNYALIFGNFGAPALGVKGAAIATSISRGVALLLLAVIMQRTTIRSIPLSLFRKFPGRELRNLFKIGLPSAGEQASYSAAQIMLTFFINMMGVEALAARTYVVNITMFGYLFCIAIAQGGAITVGHLVGSGKSRAAFVLGKFVLKRALVVTVSLSVVIACCGHWIFTALTSNPQIIAMGSILLLIDIAVEFGRPVNIFATNALRAAGDVNYPFYVGLVVMWSVQVVGGYIAGIVFGLGIYALWAMIAVDENIRGVIFVRRWWSLRWMGKSFVH